MVRKPVVAGKFYEMHPEMLKEQIEKCFRHELGPGMPDMNKANDSLKGAVIPHAGYMFSGMCAAHAFKQIREAGEYDLFIILGFSHGQLDSNEITTTKEDWETPLGKVRIDRDFIDRLLEFDFVSECEKAHEYEHSIEVQLPFLQYLYGEINFVPLSIADNCNIEKAAEKINEVIEKQNKKVCIIASSDFTHYGPSFGFVPFKENIKKNLQNLDIGAIDEIKVVNSKGFLNYIIGTNATICGKQPIALLLEILKNKVNRIEALSYYTSGDLLKDYTNSVSYASIIFEDIKL